MWVVIINGPYNEPITNVPSISDQEPEASAFRLPVDPDSLGIPDYYQIVKKPMDMSCIKGKLDKGEYTDPWEFVDDVWLMFENAWLYNRKTSRVYKWCSKVMQPQISRLLRHTLTKPIILFPAVWDLWGRYWSYHAKIGLLLWTKARVESPNLVLLWQSKRHLYNREG